MTAKVNTSTPRRPRASRPPRSAINDRLLTARDGPPGSTPLHVEIQHRMEHLWRAGGRRGATAVGRQPHWIQIRPEFLKQQPGGEHPPALSRLVTSRGLALRLELLMLFDAQCRSRPAERVRRVRAVEAKADDAYEGWQNLVLADSNSDYREATALRGRQIREALRVLADNHLVRIGGDKNRPNRRDYNRVMLLSEASDTAQKIPYTVPVPPGQILISRHFFTSLWVFALTNTEIATFLALSSKQADFPHAHESGGVFATQRSRQKQFGLKENAWRSARELHAFGLVDRRLDAKRDPTYGFIKDFGARWKKHEVMPTTFTIADEALQKAAVPTIDQILHRPTFDDLVRQSTGGWPPHVIGSNK